MNNKKLVYLCLGAVAIASVVSIFLPESESKPRSCRISRNEGDIDQISCLVQGDKPGNGYVTVFLDSGPEVSEAAINYNSATGSLTLHYYINTYKGITPVSETIETAGCCRTVKIRGEEAYTEPVRTESSTDSDGITRTEIWFDGVKLNEVVYKTD